MEINYKSFSITLKEKNYEDAFHILFRMIDNLDPDALKADKKWSKIVRNNSDDITIQALEKKFRELPKEVKKDIQNKFNKILDNKDGK